MSFTIKCNKCGTEQTVKNYGSEWKQIDVIVQTSTRGYSADTSIDELSFYCENPKCNNSVDVKY